MAFKALDTSDYVVGQVWGAIKADRFLLDQRRARLDLPSTKEAVKKMSQLWPKAATKLIEDKANGPAVISCKSTERRQERVAGGPAGQSAKREPSGYAGEPTGLS
jgi:phage terminase large subunit-like protein